MSVRSPHHPEQREEVSGHLKKTLEYQDPVPLLTALLADHPWSVAIQQIPTFLWSPHERLHHRSVAQLYTTADCR